MLFWARSVCLHPCLVSAPSTCRSTHPPCVLPTPPCQILSAIKYHFLVLAKKTNNYCHGLIYSLERQAMIWRWHWRQMTKVSEWLTKLLNWIICPPPNFGPTKNHTYTPQPTLSRCIICQHSPNQLSVPIALPNRPHTCQFAWTSQGQNDFGKYGAIILRNFTWLMYCYHVPICDFLSVNENVTFCSFKKIAILTSFHCCHVFATSFND